MTKKELSSSKKGTDGKVTRQAVEARVESQPAKKMHSLQKQDSSKYLSGDVT